MNHVGNDAFRGCTKVTKLSGASNWPKNLPKERSTNARRVLPSDHSKAETNQSNYWKSGTIREWLLDSLSDMADI